MLTVYMLALTAAALAVIRVSYVKTLGPDPDPLGVYKHFCHRSIWHGGASRGDRAGRVDILQILHGRQAAGPNNRSEFPVSDTRARRIIINLVAR